MNLKPEGGGEVIRDQLSPLLALADPPRFFSGAPPRISADGSSRAHGAAIAWRIAQRIASHRLTVFELLEAVDLDGGLVCAVRYLCGHVAHVEMRWVRVERR